MKKIILIFSLLVSLLTFSQEKYIASFNTLRLGKGEKNYGAMAEAIKNFHMVGLVEVMNRRGVEELADALQKSTGKKWDFHISPYAEGDSGYKEYYGYIWQREEAVLIKEMGFYPDPENRFTRPPYGAFFRMGNFDFILVMAHSVFGKSPSLRRAEAFNYDEVYDYFQSLDEKEKDVIIAGDFNLSGNDEAFEQMTVLHPDKIIYGIDPTMKTTIGNKGLANAYDNIFLSTIHTREFQGKSGKYDFTGGDYQRSKKEVSDHLPVFIVVDTEEDDD
ncbi:MAG: endonuclease/exonuclease/phosphatase family protein [Fusobacteriaceae bacterium]